MKKHDSFSIVIFVRSYTIAAIKRSPESYFR